MPSLHMDISHISSWPINKSNLTKQAHSLQFALSLLPINRSVILSIQHTKQLQFLLSPSLPLTYCFLRSFGKKNRILQTKASPLKISFLTHHRGLLEVIQAPGTLMEVEEHHLHFQLGAKLVGVVQNILEGVKAFQAFQHVPWDVVKLSRWSQLICKCRIIIIHFYLELKQEGSGRLIQRFSRQFTCPDSINKVPQSFCNHPIIARSSPP